MKKVLLAGVAALALTGATAAYAQHRPWFGHDHARFSPQDRLAFVDARIAAVKAGLQLTPDQEKLWPPLESAVRDFAKTRIDRANARMQSRDDDDHPIDPVARLRERADRMGETSAALKKIADAADPLYKTLDDGQKRRLMVLTRMERFGGMGWGGSRFGFGHRHHHEMNDDNGPDGRPGPGPGPRYQGDRSPDRL